MNSPDLLQRIINGYSRKTNRFEISFDGLLSFINNLVLNDESGKYSVYSTNTSDILTAQLMDLESAGGCSLEYNGTAIAVIRNHGFIKIAVKQAYDNMEANSEYPFPTAKTLGMRVPDEVLSSLHLPDGIAYAIQGADKDEYKIYKLLMNSELEGVIVEGNILRSRMLVLAVNKIRNFLTYKNNANFIYQKMVPAFAKNTRALVDTIKMVQSNPGRAASGLKKPDEFIFSFWTQMCGFIRKDLSGKENKTDHDEGLLQSAYIINAFIMYYKNIIINNKKKTEALKYVGERLRKEPYYYTISDIYSFRDKTGPLLEKKYQKEDLHDFLNSKLKVKEGNVLPELLKIKTVDNKLYYIHRSVFLNLVNSKISDAHDYYRKKYIDEWSKILRDYKSPVLMNSDEAFDEDLEKRVRTEDPLLYAVLGYELLFLSVSDSKNIKLKAVAQGWIDTKAQATKPLPIVLNLSRRHLASEVRSIVPFWLTMAFFRKLAAIFGGNRNKKKKTGVKSQLGQSSAPRSTASASAGAGISRERSVKSSGTNRQRDYRNAVENLKRQLNYSSSNAGDTLKELADEWNPLLDYEARNNLVKDVNNMVKDYMRKILRETSFAVPDAERVDNIADLLSGNKAFSSIKKRESFRRYIITYIIKTLSETRP